MDSEPAQKPQNTKLKLALDVISAGAVFWMLVVLPIWAHYLPPDGTQNESGKHFTISAFIDLIPCVFGIIWLSYRYPYPQFFEKIFDNPKFRLLFVFACLFFYYVAYLILKATVWR